MGSRRLPSLGQSLLPSGAGQEEAKGWSWQGCRNECLKMSKKLFSCALLAEPLRGSLLQRKYCNTAKMLKGQGRVPANGGKCSSYLKQRPAPWHSHLWQNEKFLFQPICPHVALKEAQAQVGKPKPPPERPTLPSVCWESRGRAVPEGGSLAGEMALLASFLGYPGS